MLLDEKSCGFILLGVQPICSVVLVRCAVLVLFQLDKCLWQDNKGAQEDNKSSTGWEQWLEMDTLEGRNAIGEACNHADQRILPTCKFCLKWPCWTRSGSQGMTLRDFFPMNVSNCFFMNPWELPASITSCSKKFPSHTSRSKALNRNRQKVIGWDKGWKHQQELGLMLLTQPSAQVWQKRVEGIVLCLKVKIYIGQMKRVDQVQEPSLLKWQCGR